MLFLVTSAPLLVANPIFLGSPVPLDFLEGKAVVVVTSGHTFVRGGVYDVGYKVVDGVLISIIYVRRTGSFTTDQMLDIVYSHSKLWGVPNSPVASNVIISKDGFFAVVSPRGDTINITKITYRNEFKDNNLY